MQVNDSVEAMDSNPLDDGPTFDNVAAQVEVGNISLRV
jgi:hypothetical protein